MKLLKPIVLSIELSKLSVVNRLVFQQQNTEEPWFFSVLWAPIFLNRACFTINSAASTAQVPCRIRFNAKTYPSNEAVISTTTGGSSATIIKANPQITLWSVWGLTYTRLGRLFHRRRSLNRLPKYDIYSAFGPGSCRWLIWVSCWVDSRVSPGNWHLVPSDTQQI